VIRSSLSPDQEQRLQQALAGADMKLPGSGATAGRPTA